MKCPLKAKDQDLEFMQEFSRWGWRKRVFQSQKCAEDLKQERACCFHTEGLERGPEAEAEGGGREQAGAAHQGPSRCLDLFYEPRGAS